jgi:hypothetical protein
MKQTAHFLLLGTGLLTACSSSKKEAPAPASPKYTVSWAVDGNAVTTDSWLTGTGDSGQLRAKTVLVSGRNPSSNNTTSEVRLEVPPAVGTYTLGPTSPAWAVYVAAGQRFSAGTAPDLTSAPGSGTIVVTKFTGKTITGTFTFTGVNEQTGATKIISNGRFFVPEEPIYAALQGC